jgi:hypothetical protein
MFWFLCETQIFLQIGGPYQQYKIGYCATLSTLYNKTGFNDVLKQ